MAIKWGINEADAQEAICLIDTPGDSPAIPLLLRLGFVVEAEDTIELKDGDRVVCQYRHIAMVRLPEPAEAPGAPAVRKFPANSRGGGRSEAASLSEEKRAERAS